jgi:hypothetical protein
LTIDAGTLLEICGSPGYRVIDIAYVSLGKNFSDFITKFLYFLIHFPPQIQESQICKQQLSESNDKLAN